MKTNNNIKYKVVFVLFCLSNILNIFMDRGSTGVNDEVTGSRIVIQLINGGALILMLCCVVSYNYPRIYNFIIVFISIIVIYIFVYFLATEKNGFSINTYIRLLTNLTGFLFFYKTIFSLKSKKIRKLVQFYVITLLLASASKILSTSMFLSDSLGAGDTASISLVFLIPLYFMFFNVKNASIIYLIAFALTIVSLRRTCIIAYVISLPFIYSYIQHYIKIKYTVFLIPALAIALIYLWQYFGVNVLIRFSEISDGSGESYGSGRSLFYKILLDDFINKPNNYIFGNGLNSVWYFYQSKDFNYLPHAHNDFLEIGYTFGLIGIFVWCSFIYKLFRQKWSNDSVYSLKGLFYMSLLIYMVVAMASGTLLRIEMLPFVMTISFILASKTKLKHENILLFQRAKYSNVLVAEDTYL